MRVGAFPSVASRRLPRLLSAFGRRYPGIELTLREGTDDEVREWLRARAVDVGVVTLPADGWATVRLAEDELCAVVPAAHALASAPAVRADHLAEDPFVMSLGGCETLIRAVLRANGVTPRVKFAVRDVDTVLALVAEGLGVTVVPALALPAALPNVAVLPLEPPIRRRLALAVRSRDAVAPAVAAFLDLARDGTGQVEPRRRGDAVDRPDQR